MNHLLDTFMPPKQLKEVLTAFYTCVNLPLQVMDEGGRIVHRMGGNMPFCDSMKAYLPPESSCQHTHQAACQQAVALGESYVFTCPAGLHHIVFPLIHKSVLLGSVLVGPFLMDAPDSTLFSELTDSYCLPTPVLLELYDCSNQIPIVPPSQVQQISVLLYYLLRHFGEDSKEVALGNRMRELQQSKINDAIQLYKNATTTMPIEYPYQLEQQLMTTVQTGDLTQADALLNQILGYVLFSQGNALEALRFRCIELCTLLSRLAIEGGGTQQRMLALNQAFYNDFLALSSLDAICMKMKEAVYAYSQSLLVQNTGKNHDIIQKCTQYMGAHLSEPLTLEEVASHVHLSPSYFSALFKQTTGVTFKERLNTIRIEESKRLLSNTDYTIIGIATAVGFESQGYFSKVFKKQTGMTPKQFR